MDGARILLPTSKNDEPKEIHLNRFAQKVLASIAPEEPQPDSVLFPDATPEAVSMAFHRVCSLLNISDIRLHDLRHTFAVRSLEQCRADRQSVAQHMVALASPKRNGLGRDREPTRTP